MSMGEDFIFIDVGGLNTTFREDDFPNGGHAEWFRQIAETEFLFVDFLAAKGLLRDAVNHERSGNLVLKWSQLTDLGQEFARAHYDKWIGTIDKAGVTGLSEAQKVEKLEARWKKFCASASN